MPVFKCNLCNYKSDRNANLTRHVQQLHTKNLERKWKCDVCSFETTYESSLRRHKKNRKIHRKTTTTTASTSSNTNNNNQSSPQLSSHQAAIALPVTTTIPPPNKHVTPSAKPATTDKSWSAVMTGPDPTHPPLYQSPQFKHEFPSLSVDDGSPTRTGSDAQYTPGLSLRPTEDSWIQGGSRPGTEGLPRSSSVPLGAPPQLAAQVGLPQQSLPPQFCAVMIKGSFATGRTGAPDQNPSPMNGRGRPESRPPPRMVEAEEVTPRPIIKEEELSRMDEIDEDMDWTYSPLPRAVDGENVTPKSIVKKEELSPIDEIDKDMCWTYGPLPRAVDGENVTPKSIVKKEELSPIDEIDKDMDWTYHDDIDYKLSAKERKSVTGQSCHLSTQ